MMMANCSFRVYLWRSDLSAVGRSMSHPRRTVTLMADELLDALRSLTGRADAEFHRDQREAIDALVNGRDRVLLVQ